MGVRWWAGDVPRLLVTFNRACSMGLATVGVAGRPGGGAGGDSFCVNLVDANGATSWRRCLMHVESLLNIAGVRVSSPTKKCLMSTVGVSSSFSNVASSLAVDVIVGPYRILTSSSRLSAIGNPQESPCGESICPSSSTPGCPWWQAHHHGSPAPDRVRHSMEYGC